MANVIFGFREYNMRFNSQFTVLLLVYISFVNVAYCNKLRNRL